MKDYFKIFDFQMTFDIDEEELTSRYYSLTRNHHPDNFTMSDSDKQLEAIQKTSLINEGYKVLKNSDLRMRHVLELSGISFEEGKEKVSQEFLMEMMDLNELIMEFQFDPQDSVKKGIILQLETLDKSMALDIKDILSNFDAASTNIMTLNIIKDYYLKRKYIQRIRNNFQKT